MILIHGFEIWKKNIYETICKDFVFEMFVKNYLEEKKIDVRLIIIKVENALSWAFCTIVQWRQNIFENNICTKFQMSSISKWNSIAQLLLLHDQHAVQKS